VALAVLFVIFVGYLFGQLAHLFALFAFKAVRLPKSVHVHHRLFCVHS
jgi:hypothetical protein